MARNATASPRRPMGKGSDTAETVIAAFELTRKHLASSCVATVIFPALGLGSGPIQEPEPDEIGSYFPSHLDKAARTSGLSC